METVPWGPCTEEAGRKELQWYKRGEVSGSSRLWEVEVMGFGDWVDDVGAEEKKGSRVTSYFESE